MVDLFRLLSLGFTSLAAVYFLYPRLPFYSFQIRSVFPRWYRDLGFRAKMGAKVKLKNNNYMAIDIHALSFDLYYPDWSGNIQLLGNVQDTRQRQAMVQHQSTPLLPSKNSTTGFSMDVLSAVRTRNPPLWHMKARQEFETYDSVLMAPMGGLGVMGNLGWDMIKQWGVLQVKSTGAVHIKANSQMPLTLNILCDNLLDAWTLEMIGVHCELDRLDVGWKDIAAAMDSLRSKLLRPRSELTQTIEDEHLKAVGI